MMITSLTNLGKAAIGLAVAPFAVVADLCTLPSSAYNNKPAFGKTATVLKSTGVSALAAIQAKDSTP